MSFIDRILKRESNKPKWIIDIYKEKEEKINSLRNKYLMVIDTFEFDKFVVFSELCIAFRRSFFDLIETRDLEYCEYYLKLSPKVNFKIQRLEGEIIEYRRKWEAGISQEIFYDPPLLIGDVRLRPGTWIDNSSYYDCFQLIRTCDKCGSIIPSGRCYGIATIGHFLIYNQNDYHNCPVAKKEHQEDLTKKAIERFNVNNLR